MTRGFGAVLRYVVVGLLLLAMLVAPLAPLTAPARASALSDHCGRAAGSLASGPVATDTVCASGSPCTSGLEWAAASRSGCPNIDGASGLGDGCMALDCHAMHVSLPIGDALPLVIPPPASAAMPGTVPLNGIAVDPALEPPRSSI